MEIDYNNYMFANIYMQVDIHGGIIYITVILFSLKDIIEGVNSGTSMYKNKNGYVLLLLLNI